MEQGWEQKRNRRPVQVSASPQEKTKYVRSDKVLESWRGRSCRPSSRATSRGHQRDSLQGLLL